MKRQIKHRGRSIVTGEWLYAEVGDVEIIGSKIYINDRSCNGLPFPSRVIDPLTLSDAIGVKDRNGVDIFEGDVVFWLETDMRGAVRGGQQGAIIWNRHTLAWEVLRDHKTKDGRDCIIPYPHRLKHLEVVGNVHDNPDMMPDYIGSHGFYFDL